jgi:hypothetical protein
MATILHTAEAKVRLETDAETDVLHVLGIYGRHHRKVTETDIIVWFKGQHSAMDIRAALRQLEEDRRVMATTETYWNVVK